MIVIGPSFKIDTCISAPNLPVSTGTIFSSIYSIYYIIITIVISLFIRLITVFIYGIIGTISIIFFCDLQTNYKHCLHLLNHII